MKIGDTVKGTWTIRKVGPTGRIVGTQEVTTTGTVDSLNPDQNVARVNFAGTVVELPVGSLTVTGSRPVAVEPLSPPTPQDALRGAVRNTDEFEALRAAIAAQAPQPPAP